MLFALQDDSSSNDVPSVSNASNAGEPLSDTEMPDSEILDDEADNISDTE